MILTVASLMRAKGALLTIIDRRSTRLALAVGVVSVLSFGGYALRPAPMVSTNLAEITVLAQAPGLSDLDKSIYAAIFDAQDDGEYATADTLMTQLEDPVLVGHVLAVRYLNKGYSADKHELTAWLASYGDLPEAPRVASLAARKGAATEDVAVISTTTPLKGDGYLFHLGRTTMPDGWYRGLRLWKEKNYRAAGEAFAAVGANAKLNEWQRSAGNYWNYRSLLLQSRGSEANDALATAAAEPLTFYGQLALARLGRAMPVRAEAPYVSYALRRDPAVARAAAFSALGMGDAAELELRHLYHKLDDSGRKSLISLAGEMGLSNLQVRFAQSMPLTADEALFANYPVPAQMEAAAAPIIDPALVLAVARQESAFRDVAQSGAGAVGMMQMLPSTAKHVLRSDLSLADNDDTALPIAQRLNDEVMSARLGATYLKMLTREPAIGENVMKMLAGYNAGPGAVQNWSKATRNMNDPLLYLESIPYPETHNYVTQVLAHYWIYQRIRGYQPGSLAQLARGQWPTVG